MVLKITSDNPALKTRFIQHLAKCAGGKLKQNNAGNLVWDPKAPDPATPFSQALDDAIKSNRLVPMKIKQRPPATGPGANRWFDEFCDRTVYLDHLDALPEDPPANAPQATTRCEAIIHFLVEYTDAAENGETSCTAGFHDGHREGFAAQRRYRRAKGQGDPKDQVVGRNGDCNFIHADESKTVGHKDGDGNVTVEHVPAPQKNTSGGKPAKPKPDDKKKKKDDGSKSARTTLPSLIEDSPYRFSGTVQSLGPRPAGWSSICMSYQRVTYRLADNLGAPIQGDFIDVEHPLVQFSASADRARPGLSRQIFAPGRGLIVLGELGESEDGGLTLRATSADPVLTVIERPIPPGWRPAPGATRRGAKRRVRGG